ncbi:MAG: hypothetical protein HQ478_11590 [Chloroflexi bacterium]|nr:hypothetical protein [Chloroflexota bacterium]
MENVQIAGSGKGPEGWFKLNQVNVYYDHPYHAPLDHALIIDFVKDASKPGERVAVELSRDSAIRLIDGIQSALSVGEEAHAI